MFGVPTVSLAKLAVLKPFIWFWILLRDEPVYLDPDVDHRAFGEIPVKSA